MLGWCKHLILFHYASWLILVGAGIPPTPSCSCAEYRNGAKSSDTQLCMGPPESWGRPCYPYNGYCNSDWMYCTKQAPAPAPTPTPLGGATGVVTFGDSCVSFHICVVLSNGGLKCWGWGGIGALGRGDTSSIGQYANQMGENLPYVELGGHTVTDVSLGNAHTCAVLDDGTIKCWGWNYRGMLGLGDTAHRGDNPGEMGANLPHVDLGQGQNVKVTKVSCGIYHTCARPST